MTPLVSFIAPVRGRLDGLARMVNSIMVTLPDLSQAELLLKVDDDDTAVAKYAHHLAYVGPLKIRVVEGPRGRGYADLHLFVNELCRRSQGRWLWLFNDDVEITTPMWNQELERISDTRPAVVHHNTTNIRANGTRDKAGSNLFPIISRSMYDVMGHFSLSAHNDAYINEIVDKLPQLVKPADFHINHYLEEQMETRDYSMGNITMPHHLSKEVRDGQAEDVRRLKEKVQS